MHTGFPNLYLIHNESLSCTDYEKLLIPDGLELLDRIRFHNIKAYHYMKINFLDSGVFVFGCSYTLCPADVACTWRFKHVPTINYFLQAFFSLVS